MHVLYQVENAVLVAYEPEEGSECLVAAPSGFRAAADAGHKVLNRFRPAWKIGVGAGKGRKLAFVTLNSGWT